MHFARYETRGLLASENMPCCIEKPPRCIRATACRQGPFGRLLVTRRCRFVCVALYSADFGLDMSLPLTATQITEWESNGELLHRDVA
ncbi:MAG: hypothetical protein QOG14_1213 [Mycobacterium sp.]|nr:hypothetical protein [Mycobacterium sp.]